MTGRSALTVLVLYSTSLLNGCELPATPVPNLEERDIGSQILVQGCLIDRADDIAPLLAPRCDWKGGLPFLQIFPGDSGFYA